ncbi:MAG: sigma-70 family RNA polymerase sigma factor [Verrucomicrobiota bacterium]
MARTLRIEHPGAAYHAMARGNQGRAIYADDLDRKRCQLQAFFAHGNGYNAAVNQPSNADPDATPTVAGGERTGAVFATTHWSVVLAAGQSGDTAAGPALEALCRAYWYPVYAFLRRRGIQPADAEDFTQGFFAHLLERGVLGRANPERGRFRSFLLACLNHYVADERDKARAQRRGGGQAGWALDLSGAGRRYALEPAHEETPDRLFEKQWALTIMERALERLREEQTAAGRGREFEVLQQFLTGATEGGDYSEAAARAGLSANAVAVAVHRLRRRFRDWVREEAAATLAVPGDVEEELRHLLAALRGET